MLTPTRMFSFFLSLFLLMSHQFQVTQARIFSCAAAFAYCETCQTACNAGWVTCMSSAGLVAGATVGIGGVVIAAGCSLLQCSCMNVCYHSRECVPHQSLKMHKNSRSSIGLGVHFSKLIELQK